jgi:peroxiredoxin
MQVYLWKQGGKVVYYAAKTEAEAKRIAEKLGGFTTAPVSSCTEQEWETAGSTAYIDSTGLVVLGLAPDKEAQQQRTTRLEEINAELARIDAEAGPRPLRDVALAQKAALPGVAAKAFENIEAAESKAAPLRTERAMLIA